MGDTPDPPRWLNAEEEAAWVLLTGLMLKLPSAVDTDLRRRSGVSYFEYLILSCLSEPEDRTLLMGDLATLANSSPSRLSHAVGRLETRGWIVRHTDPANARFTLARLTDAGFAFLAAAAPEHVETVRSLVFDALEPEQVEQLKSIAASILAQTDTEHDWPPRGTRHGIGKSE